MYWKFLFALVLLFSVPVAGADLHARTEPGSTDRLDREKWETLTEKLDYPLPSPPVEEQPRERTREAKEWPMYLKVIAVLVAIGILAFILLQLLSGGALFGPKNKKFEKGPKVSLENIEANLPEADIPDFIREALLAGDYKMAVRLHYLGLIQLLARQEWIEWKPGKTNGDYLAETRPRSVFEDFFEATLAFERIWYGDRSLEAMAYRKIADDFAHLEQAIKTS